jgi:4-hydroxy-tetrahydrodipicolinate reductase
MKIALLGYGKMGKEVEKAALARNHEICMVIDVTNARDLNEKNLTHADMAIDFSTPDSAYGNIITCFRSGTPIVSGTTGWLTRFDEVMQLCREKEHAFFYASNFSLGVNILFKFNEYDCSIEEIHHIHKLDAPSGTAITLASDLIETIDRKTQWELDAASDTSSIKITAIRENEVPGTHTIIYDSAVDSIVIRHAAKNRKGLALGAVLAAEFLLGKKGYYTMSDLLGF